MKHRLFLIAAALVWSTGGAAIKLCNLSGWQIACGRSLIAALFLGLLFKDARRKLDRKLLLVGIAYAGTVVLFVLANKLGTSANAIFLQDTAPLYVLLFSPIILHERPSRSELLAAPIFFLGLLLFFVDELAPGQLWGNVLALSSGVCFGLMILGLRKIGDVGLAAVVWGNAIAAILTLPMALTGPAPVGMDLPVLLFLGVVQLGMGYLFFARGIRGVPAVEASLIILLEPVLNPVWAFFAAGEIPGRWAMVGGAIILVATVWRTVHPVIEQRLRGRTAGQAKAPGP